MFAFNDRLMNRLLMRNNNDHICLFIVFQSTSSLDSNLEGLASVLEADLPNYRQRILKVLCDW